MRAARSARDDRGCRTGPWRAGKRSGPGAAGSSWHDLVEHAHLPDQKPPARMDDLEREAELAVGQFGVGDGEIAGREPFRQRQAAAENLDEIVLVAEDQRPFPHIDRERHADTAADIFLEPGRSGKTLCGMDDLRKTCPPGIEPRPDLA